VSELQMSEVPSPLAKSGRDFQSLALQVNPAAFAPFPHTWDAAEREAQVFELKPWSRRSLGLATSAAGALDAT